MSFVGHVVVCSVSCLGNFFCVSGSAHKPVNDSLLPLHTAFPLWKTFTCSVSYVTLYPESISILIDISDVCTKLGTICAALAA